MPAQIVTPGRVETVTYGSPLLNNGGMTVSGRVGKLGALATLVGIYVAGTGAVVFAPADGCLLYTSDAADE